MTQSDKAERTGDVLGVAINDICALLKQHGPSDSRNYLITAYWDHANALNTAFRSTTEDSAERRSGDEHVNRTDVLEPMLLDEDKIDARRFHNIVQGSENDDRNDCQRRLRAMEYVCNELSDSVKSLVNYSNGRPE